MQNARELDILEAKDGWIDCPKCGRHLLRITRDTEAKRLPMYCRGCRTETILNIGRGRSA